MELTAGQIWDGTAALMEIINRPRQIPQIAKYRISKLFGALEDRYQAIELSRVDLVKELGHETLDETSKQSLGWQVPAEKMDEYKKRWTDLRNAKQDVPGVSPMYLSSFGDPEHSGIEAHEFRSLGPLVVEDPEAPPKSVA